MRNVLLVGGGALLVVLARGAVRPLPSGPASTPPAGRPGRSAQAARTDPAFLVAPHLPASGVDVEATRLAIRDAGTTVYLPTMFAETDSVLRRWPDADDAALRVAYVLGGVPGWEAEDQAIAREALRAWEQVAPVRFVEVLDTAEAQLIVRWIPRFAIDRTGQTDLTWDEQGRIHRAVIQLALADSGGRAIAPDGLRAVAMHEVGHALGLPHSDMEGDLMYPTTRHPAMTPRDIATVQLLYRLPPVSLK